LKLMLPFSGIQVEINAIAHCDILTATRGPDSEQSSLYAKQYGASVIRWCIKDWAYGNKKNPSDLIHMADSNEIITDVRRVEAHYAEHMVSAFHRLFLISKDNQAEADETFFRLIRDFWYHRNYRRFRILMSFLANQYGVKIHEDKPTL